MIDTPDDTQIPVEYTDTALSSDPVLPADLPFQLIIILNLHDLVAFTEQTAAVFFLLFLIGSGIQILLQDPIQPFNTKRPFRIGVST